MTAILVLCVDGSLGTSFQFIRETLREVWSVIWAPFFERTFVVWFVSPRQFHSLLDRFLTTSTMPPRYDSVRSVFEEAQRGFQIHKKLLAALKKLHDKSSQDEFQESFLWHLKHAMLVFNREPAVERVIEFVAKYATLKDHRIPQVQKVIYAS